MAAKRSNLGKVTAVGLAIALAGILGMVVVGALSALSTRQDPAREESYQRDVTLVRDNPLPQFPIVLHDEGGVDEKPVASTDDPAADDGELHDARVSVEGYRLKEESWTVSEVKHLKSYDADVSCQFVVNYPQLEGDLEHADEINELLRNTARETARTYYEDPSEETVARIKQVVGDNPDLKPEDADLLLGSNVSYAVSYNSEDLLSVCFSDECTLGSMGLEFIRLRTVNANVKTGEVYTRENTMMVNRSLATSYVDNLLATTGEDANGDKKITDDECLSVALVGRRALIRGLMGRGELVDENRLSTCLFIDGNGKPNLGATYWLSGENGYVRGWWDVTLTDEQLEDCKLTSSLWELLG